MTCNDASGLSLSSQVDLLCLTLQRPSRDKLLEHLVLVAVCEGLHTSLAWLAQIADACHNDVR